MDLILIYNKFALHTTAQFQANTEAMIISSLRTTHSEESLIKFLTGLMTVYAI